MTYSNKKYELNKEKYKEYARKYYNKNKAKCNEYSKNYYKENKNKIKSLHKKYNEKHSSFIRAYHRDRHRGRKLTKKQFYDNDVKPIENIIYNKIVEKIELTFE